MPPPQFLITYLIFEWQQKMEKAPIKAGRFIDGASLLLEDLKMKLLPAIITLAATISLCEGIGSIFPSKGDEANSDTSKGDEANSDKDTGKCPLGLFNTVLIFMRE